MSAPYPAGAAPCGPHRYSRGLCRRIFASDPQGDLLASIIHQFLVAQALHLKAGRIEAVARAYAVPLVVSLPGVVPSFVVISSRAGIEHFFRLKYEGLRAAGIPYLRVRVAETHPTGRDRITVVAEWFYLTHDGSRAGQATARYFLQRQHGAITVHMIEFERVAFPALADWFRTVGTERPPRRRLH